jgi:dipeptidyl aminopeptidase/acylaminoacyl peptidase
MGGHITLRSMVISDEIKAGVIWGGVVGAYPDLFARGYLAERAQLTPEAEGTRWPTQWRNWMTRTFGSASRNPGFYSAISANAFLDEISGPLQLHHATTDDVVPSAVSELLQGQMERAGQYSELYLYDGDNHNIAVNFYTAMGRSLAFFDEYVKGITP